MVPVAHEGNIAFQCGELLNKESMRPCFISICKIEAAKIFERTLAQQIYIIEANKKG